MKISIIIPIYNVEKYINECLESIKNQNFQDFEVIMINDGSQDGCDRICQKFWREDPRFKYFYQNNQGVSVARNNGFKRAQGKYIYFMDPDDTFSPDFLQSMYDEAEKTGVDMVVNTSVYTDLSTQKKLPLSLTTPGIYDASLENYFPEGYLWYKLFRKDLLDRANVTFWEKCRIREDELFCMMVYPYCKQFSVINQGYYFYRQHPESALGKASKDKLVHAESIKMILPAALDFYAARQHHEYFPLSLNLLPFLHNWHSSYDYWKFVQQVSRIYDLKEWKGSLHPYLQQAIIKQSYPVFLVRMALLYGSGYWKRLRKKSFSIRIRKNYQLVRLFGVTLLENRKD